MFHRNRVDSSNQGWLREEALRQLRRVQASSRTSKIRWVYSLPKRRPIPVAFTAQALVLVVSLIFTAHTVIFFPQIAPENPQALLSVAWQVHASFVAIAFAGLAMLFQSTSSELVVSAESLRSVLFKDTSFQLTLIFSLVGTIQLGIVSTWFPSHASLVVQMVGTVGISMAMITRAYLRANRLLGNPGVAFEKSAKELIFQLRASMENTFAAVVANQRLENEIPKRWHRELGSSAVSLVKLEEGQVFDDANLRDLLAIRSGLVKRRPVGRIRNGSVDDVYKVDEKEGIEDGHVTIQLNIGQRASSSIALFVVNLTDVKIDVDGLESRLRRAVKIGKRSMRRSVFELELRMLRDSIVESAGRAEQRRTTNALDILRTLLTEAPRVHTELHGSPGSVEVRRRWYGPEWDEIISVVRDVQSLGKEIHDYRVRHNLLVTLFRFVQDSLIREDVTSSYHLSESLVDTWGEMASCVGQWSTGDSSYFLTRLREITYTLPADSRFDRSAALIVTRLYVLSAKRAIDESSQTGCREILDILGDVNRHMSAGARKNEFNKLHMAALLVLVAWDMRQSIMQGSSRSIPDADHVFAEITDGVDIVDLVEASHDPELSEALQRDWWEIPQLRGRAVSANAEMSAYIDLAALRLFWKEWAGFPRVPTKKSADFALRIREVWDQVERGVLRGVNDVPVGRSSDFLRAELDRHIDEWKRTESLAVADSSIDPAIVSAFFEKLESRLSKSETIIQYVNQVVDGESEGSFGLKRLQPKELFLSANRDIGAVMLADSIGEAVDFGEAEELISIVLEHDSTSITLEELSIVEAWISRQRYPGVVVATNSWTAYRVLKELNVGQKAALLRCHASSEGMFIFGFVTPSGIRIRRQKVGLERSTDRLLGDDRVVAAVDQLSDEDVEKIAIANPDKYETTIRGYVYVRVFESLRIDVVDPSEIAVWTLPESAY